MTYLGSRCFSRHLKGVAKNIVLVCLTFTKGELLVNFGAVLTSQLCLVHTGAFFHRNRCSAFFPEELFTKAINVPIYAVSRDATVAQIVKGYGANLDQHGNYYPRFLFLVDGRCSVLF